MRALIIGQAPSRLAGHVSPLDGRSGARLAELAGVTNLAMTFDLLNLVDYWPGRRAVGDDFPMADAKTRAAALMETGFRNDRVVLLGRNVAHAFGVADVDYLDWFPGLRSGQFFAVSPHPSGLNRWWNVAGNEAAARKFFRDLAMEAS